VPELDLSWGPGTQPPGILLEQVEERVSQVWHRRASTSLKDINTARSEARSLRLVNVI